MSSAVAPPTTAVAAPSRSRAQQLLRDYLTLTKPKVQSLLLFTTVAAMLTAGTPSVWLVLAVLVGGAMSAGGAGAVNHFYDRDVDAQMGRTKDRPVPSGRVSPRAALTFGLVLGAASVVWLAVLVNPLAAAVSFAGYVGYALVYTMWLKRRYASNIVWGGSAGAFPPVVGWVAVTGSLDWQALVLFLIVFCWTPPHFWALSLLMEGEYRKVGIPMLPVAKGAAFTRQRIVVYTVLLVAVTALPLAGFASVGACYAGAVVLLGGAFLLLAERLRRRADRPAALRTYLFSLLYLAILVGTLALDARL